MDLFSLINDYWPVLVAIGVLADAISGYLPDKWVRYIGVIRRIVRMMGRGGGGALAVLLVGCLVLSGCFASVSVNPETGLVKYTRLGGQEISGLKVEKKGENIDVKLDSAKSSDGAETVTAVNDLLKSVGALAR